MLVRTFLLTLASVLVLPLGVALHAQTPAPKRIAIVKADDVRGMNGKWDRFIALAQERDVKVSIGLIGNSLEKKDDAYAAWLKKWEESGKVEFWHHGWDHKRWKAENGKEVSEFGGSGYPHQKEHLDKTQALIKPVLGKPFQTFGSPFNAVDADSVKALNELPELKLVFCYPGNKLNEKLEAGGKVLLPMTLRGEHDGTGKPNFEKFKAEYAAKNNPDLKLAAVQFHPLGFSEQGFKDFASILDLMKADGWTFVLPGEYLKLAH